MFGPRRPAWADPDCTGYIVRRQILSRRIQEWRILATRKARRNARLCGISWPWTNWASRRADRVLHHWRVKQPVFRDGQHPTGILQNITFLGFLSIGVGLVLMAGEIDIPVGSIFGLTGVATALVLRQGYPLAAAIASGLLVGVACGLVNGLVAQVIKIPVVVMILATLGIYRAIALALANGSRLAACRRTGSSSTGSARGRSRRSPISRSSS